MSTQPNGADPCALTGRIVLVTGAGQGVGRAIAHRCAELGATIVVNDFYPDRAERVAAELTGHGRPASAAGCDVTDFEAVQAMVAGSSGPRLADGWRIPRHRCLGPMWRSILRGRLIAWEDWNGPDFWR